MRRNVLEPILFRSKILLDLKFRRVAEPMSVQQNAPQTPTPSMVSGASGGSTGPPPRKKEKRQKRETPQVTTTTTGPEVVIHREDDEEEEGNPGWQQ